MKKFILLCIIWLIGSGISQAADLYTSSGHDKSKFAVSLKGGTLGAGIEGTTSIIPDTINARLGFNAMQFDFHGTESDIKYEFDVELGVKIVGRAEISTLFVDK